MKPLQFKDTVIGELQAALDTVDDGLMEDFVTRLVEAPHIFVTGLGRTGLAAKAFTMRLMHMGLPAYLVGEIVTPSFRAGDLLVCCSGSGETPSQVLLAAKAKEQLGGKVVLVTVAPDSSIGKLADCTVCISAPTPKLKEQRFSSIQPMGSLFEQSLLLVLDIAILKLMDRKKMTGEEMYTRHTNLE